MSKAAANRCRRALAILLPVAWINILFTILESTPARGWLLTGRLVPSVLEGVALLAFLGSWAGGIFLWFTTQPLLHSSWLWLIALIPLGFIFGSIYTIVAARRFSISFAKRRGELS